MIFSRKKKRIAQLKEEFGQVNIKKFNFNLIEQYFIHKDNSNSNQVISDQIWDDLDMELFFAIIDHTSSTVGQQCLYNRLRNINFNAKDQIEQEDIISELLKDEKVIFEIQYLLEKIKSHKSYYLPSLFQGNHLEAPKWFFIIPFFSLLTALSIVLSFFNSNFLVLFLIMIPINATIHFLNKKNVNLYIDSVPMLLTLNSIAKKLMQFNQLKPLIKNTKKSTQVLDKVKRRLSIFKLEQKVDSDIEMTYWFVLELIKIVFLLEPLLLFNIIKRLQTKRKEIEDVFTFVGNVDIIVSIISMRKANDQHCKPTISINKTCIDAVDMEHPLVPECVENSFNCSTKSFLITGSNMSGKTTFIRAIALNMISGVSLNTCFAKSFSFQAHLKIHTAIRIADDISTSSSYFFKEVETIKEIISSVNESKGHVVFLDELFKGTNTIERIALAKSILSYLHQKQCYVFVSTHDFELTNLLKEEYDLFHFSESILNGELTYEYKIKQGVLKKGNAINILKLNDFPTKITSEAEKIVNN